MVASGVVERKTQRIGLSELRFDFPNWGDEFNKNLRLLDAVIGPLSGTVSGVWSPNTAYVVGQRLIDDETGLLYEVLIAHTSPDSGTLAEDAASHPGRWRLISAIPSYRGGWATGTQYYSNEFVTSGLRYGVVTNTYVSGASYDADVANGNIVTLIDITTPNADIIAARNAAQASATAASNSASAAAASQATALENRNDAVFAKNGSEAARNLARDYRDAAEGYKNLSLQYSQNSAASADLSAQAYAQTIVARDTTETYRNQAQAALTSFNSIYYGARNTPPPSSAVIGSAYLDTSSSPIVYRVKTQSSPDVWSPTVTTSIGGIVSVDFPITTYPANQPFTVGPASSGDVYINGVLLRVGTEYSITFGSNTSFSINRAITADEVVSFRGAAANDATDYYTKAETNNLYSRIDDSNTPMKWATVASAKISASTPSFIIPIPAGRKSLRVQGLYRMDTDASLQARVSTDGGVTYRSAANSYFSGQRTTQNGATVGSSDGAGSTSMLLGTTGRGNASLPSVVNFFAEFDENSCAQFIYNSAGSATAGSSRLVSNGMSRTDFVGLVTHVMLFPSSGSFLPGTRFIAEAF